MYSAGSLKKMWKKETVKWTKDDILRNMHRQHSRIDSKVQITTLILPDEEPCLKIQSILCICEFPLGPRPSRPGAMDYKKTDNT